MSQSGQVAVLCSAHGFGHLTRQLAIGEELARLGARPVFFTAAPREVVEGFLPGAEVVPWAVDVGLAQRDGLSEDLPLTLARLAERCSEAAIDRLAAALRGFGRAVVDIAPSALEACRRAEVPALAVGNFDWAWIYGHYPELQAWARRFASWQAGHRVLALWPGPPLTGFAGVERFGLVGRRRPAQRLASRSVLVSFGGFGLDELERRLPRVPGVTYVLTPPVAPIDRSDCLYVEGVPFPALVAGADAVYTKPGYGILAEAALAGTPIAWVDRGSFPEAPFLEEAMAARGDVKVRGGLAEALDRLFSRPRPEPVDPGGAREVAARILA
jgi:hypothetical protein